MSDNVVRFPTGSTGLAGSTGSEGSALLDDLRDWYATYIRPLDPVDLNLLPVWTAHTHVPVECYTSPRLQIDSSMYGSGKTTLCEHLSHLCGYGVLMAQVSSSTTMVRLLHANPELPATLIIDEADRNLKPDRPGVGDLLSVVNSGYKVGATRPVTMPDGQGGWRVENMPTFAPVVISGNAPLLPDDTRSRCLRILLVPDVDGLVDDTDWEMIEGDATHLKKRIGDWASGIRDQITGLPVDLPGGCRGRMKDKWRPLMRVAVVAGGHWPRTVWDLAERDIRDQLAEREDGHHSMPPAMRLMHHLHELWGMPDGLFHGSAFVSTKDVLAALRMHHPEDWGSANAKGRELTAQGLGRMIRQVGKVFTERIEHGGPRGYLYGDLSACWRRLGIAAPVTGPAHAVQTGPTGPTGRHAEPVVSVQPVAPISAEGVGTGDEPDVPDQTACAGSEAGAGTCPVHVRPLVNGRCGLCIAQKHNQRVL